MNLDHRITLRLDELEYRAVTDYAIAADCSLNTAVRTLIHEGWKADSPGMTISDADFAITARLFDPKLRWKPGDPFP